MHITSPNLAGRLFRFVCNWEKTTQDQWVLQFIAGYQLEVTQTQTTTRDLTLREGAQKITGDQGTPNSGCNCGSPTVHKQLHIPDLGGKEVGGQRLINLKGLNSIAKLEHFKMEGLHVLPDL